MTIKSIDYIVTAKHYSEREGAGGSVRARILKMREKIHKGKGIAIQIIKIDQPSGEPVKARIWQGQWIADCECGGAEFVDASEAIFFCFSCVNRANNSRVRPVEFPADLEAIEAEILKRPVDDVRGMSDLERVGLARPVLVLDKEGELLPLVRSWNPGESVADLVEQNQIIDVWHRELRKGSGVIKLPSKDEEIPKIPPIEDVLNGLR